MNIFSKISNLFRKKQVISEDEFEEEYRNALAEENEREIMEEYSGALPASVIMYIINDEVETEQIIQPLILIEDFIIPVEPEKDSIIWIQSNEGQKPYKVLRIDYMHNTDGYQSYRQYIIVEPATAMDILNLNNI